MDKINDLNPKNENYHRYKQAVKSYVLRRASAMYQDLYFWQEYKSVFLAASAIKYLANIASGLTVTIAIYLACKLLFGTLAAVCLAVLLSVLFEVLKHRVWNITAKQYLKYKQLSVFALSSLAALHLVSLCGSAFGAWNLPNLVSEPQQIAVNLTDIDSLKASYLAQIVATDKQLADLSHQTNSSTIRKAVKNLTDQKNTILKSQNLAVQDAKLQNDKTVQANKETLTAAKKQHNNELQAAKYYCLGASVFFEVIFVLCSVFVAYYLFRAAIDMDSESEQEPLHDYPRGGLQTVALDDEKNQAGQRPEEMQKRAVIQGFSKQDSKRHDGNRLNYTKICAFDDCQRPFVHSIHNQKYCCENCRKEAYIKRKQVSF